MKEDKGEFRTRLTGLKRTRWRTVVDGRFKIFKRTFAVNVQFENNQTITIEICSLKINVCILHFEK